MPTSTLRAVVHIGPIKTGSSAANKLMIALRDKKSLPAGLIYPGVRIIEMPDGKLVRVKSRDIRFLSPALAWDRETGEKKTKFNDTQRMLAFAKFDRYLEVITAEARVAGKDATILIIQEVLARLPEPKEVVKNLLRHFDRVDLFFVARRQRFIVPSAITQRVKQAYFPKVQSASVDDFLDNPNLKKQFNYDEIYANWNVGGEKVSVTPVPFLESDRGTDRLFRRIAKAMGFELPIELPYIPSNNETPNRATLLFMMWFKRNFARKKAKNGGTFYLGSYWPIMNTVRFITRLWRSPRWVFQKEDLENIEKAYLQNNAVFKKQLKKLASNPEWEEWFESEKVGAK